MILITTSRRPTRRVRTFVKELERMIPWSTRVQRGKTSFEKLKDLMTLKGCDRLVVVESWRGNPGRIQFFVLERGDLRRKVVVWISSLSLQVDVKKKFSASDLTVSIDESAGGDQTADKLFQFLKGFLEETMIIGKSEGVSAELRVSVEGGRVTLSFVNAKSGRLLRPVIGLSSVMFYE